MVGRSCVIFQVQGWHFTMLSWDFRGGHGHVESISGKFRVVAWLSVGRIRIGGGYGDV